MAQLKRGLFDVFETVIQTVIVTASYWNFTRVTKTMLVNDVSVFNS